MIDIRELRIGIWVFDRDGRMVRIDGIENKKGAYVAFFKEDYPNGGDYCGDLKPIPLTPEILEACGFEKDKDGCLKINNVMYWLDTGYLQIAIGYAPAINVPCKHLHQLQNLYWCLTETELKYSP